MSVNLSGVFFIGGSPDNRRLGQLQVLYNARGRKIEELDRELKSVTESSEREIRILKHKLALSQDERDGLNGSLSNTQQLLREARGKENEMAGKITALETQISALTGAKEEVSGQRWGIRFAVKSFLEDSKQETRWCHSYVRKCWLINKFCDIKIWYRKNCKWL